MNKEKRPPRHIVTEKSKLKKEVTELSRALNEVKHTKTFYMVNCTVIHRKDGAFRSENSTFYYCRKKDAIKFLETTLKAWDTNELYKGNGRMISDTEAIFTGLSSDFKGDVEYHGRVEKINPI